ncbi:hypothetical protein SEVIR_4G093400v4 [Setaria viridis]|uniref:Uncharacterized protein n=2 Tax=Setaria TaxID=4554 RepID=K3Y4F6_SETIT|nr:hypothetical protein SETIT_4G093700v2 [Setaria italica]TKW20507.1 hypothetical protein SEVIR_4G093400v2 [Setaria viridis]
MLPMPLLLLFSIRVDLADPDLAAGLQALVRANHDAAAAAAAAPPSPAPPPQRRPAAPWVRPRWAERESARSLLPPPISSLRRRPALVRTRTGDGRLVITHRGEGSVGRGGLVCTRRREGEGQGQGHLTMRLL